MRENPNPPAIDAKNLDRVDARARKALDQLSQRVARDYPAEVQKKFGENARKK